MPIRLNTNRLTHSARQALNALPFQFPVHKMKSIFVILVLFVLSLQLLMLSSPQSVKLPYSYGSDSSTPSTETVLVVDKNTATATHYKYLLEKYSARFPALSTAKKCQLYFDELYNLNENWEVLPPDMDANADYKKEIFNHDQFIKDQIAEYKKTNNEEPSDGKKAEFELKFQEVYEKTRATEQLMVDAVTHLRVFGQCYLKDSNAGSSMFTNIFGSQEGQEDESPNSDAYLCSDVEHRLFPWLSRELPTFRRWDWTLVKGIPKMSKYIDSADYDDLDMPYSFQDESADAGVGANVNEGQDVDVNAVGEQAQRAPTEPLEGLVEGAAVDGGKLRKRSSQNNQCFMNQWRASLNGKGIVLSVADKYANDLKGLIRVLRALNNKLPIQLVHKGDLSEKVQRELIEVARSDEVDVPLHVYDQIRGDVPHNFPKQELWFVNAKRCIEPQYANKFNGFSNKLIAYLFNSFDEILLMDTDSIPLVKPSTFFQLGPYQRTQTVFFKDRFNAEKVAQHDSDFFMKLMPSAVDQALFHIPKVGNVTTENRYIKDKFRHLMEAGMVGVKRSTHFTGILTSIQINFWSATSSRIWGDKELFWLGQSASGNENYEFNKYDVVSVGELTPMEDRPRHTIAHELCSTHPGHLSGDDDYTLLWINSGMRFCKVDTWEKDMAQDKIRKHFKDANEVEKYYKAPLRINAALIPPGGDRIRNNNNDEPARGWVMNNICKGYLWCAYDIVGGSTDPADRGAYVEYNNVTEYRNYYLGKLWLEQDLVKMSDYPAKMAEFKKVEAERQKVLEELKEVTPS